MNRLTKKSIFIVGLVALTWGLIFNYLFYDRQLGLSFFIYIVLILGGIAGLMSAHKVAARKSDWLLSLVILFFAFLVMGRESEVLQFFNVIMVLGLLLLLARQLSGQRVRNFLFPDYLKTAVVVPFWILAKSFRALSQMGALVFDFKGGAKTTRIVKGLLITVPLVSLFIILFYSADLVFARVINSLFNFNFQLNAKWLGRAAIILIVSFIWLGAYVYILDRSESQQLVSESPVIRKPRFGKVEAIMLFSSLIALFLAFVSVQVKYLFSGHEAIWQFGYTYAEYVHKGFGELIVVAGLTFLVIYFSAMYLERPNGQTGVWFKILSSGLIVLVLIIMASALMRLSVYEEAYGFTVLRILVQSFIIWLAAVFIWLAFKIYFDVSDRNFSAGIVILVLIFFGVFNLFNPEALVARQNIQQFTNREELDTDYLLALS